MMRTKLVVIAVTVAAVTLLGYSGQKTESERFIEYYEGVAKILEDNKDNPDKALDTLNIFMAKNKDDYIEVTNALNNFSDDEKKEFVDNFGDRLLAAFDKYWATLDWEVGKDDRIGEVLEQVPMLDIMAFDKFFK
jgi:hypothetical protein